MQVDINDVLVDKYLEILYPEDKELSSKDKAKKERTRALIEKNLDSIDEEFYTEVISQSTLNKNVEECLEDIISLYYSEEEKQNQEREHEQQKYISLISEDQKLSTSEFIEEIISGHLEEIKEEFPLGRFKISKFMDEDDVADEKEALKKYIYDLIQAKKEDELKEVLTFDEVKTMAKREEVVVLKEEVVQHLEENEIVKEKNEEYSQGEM